MELLKKSWKYRYIPLILLLILLAFSRPVFLFLHIPNSFHEGLALFLVILVAILVFTLLEEFTRSFFVPDQKKKSPPVPQVQEPLSEKHS